MPTWHRIIGLLALVTFVTGCTTYRQAALPPPATGAQIDFAESLEVVRPGMTVRVLLRSGEEVTSEVMQVSPEAFVVGRTGNYGWQERTIAADEILRLEVQRNSMLTRVLTHVVGTTMLVAVVGIVALGLAFSGSDLGGLS